MIDVHCHIDAKEFDSNRDEIISNAVKVGVTKIVSSALNIDSLEKTFLIMEKYPSLIFCTASLDYTILDLDKVNEFMMEIRRRINKIIGIGEVGLDYFIFIKEEEKKKQETIFKNWISFSNELNMPIVVHSRSAGKYAIKILTEEGAKRVIMHAFDGSVGYAIEGVKKGFYFSIPPSIVRSEQKQKMAKHLPLDKILLESDAPVLGPTKDIINTPSNIVISAAKIAEIKKIPINEVINATTKNAQEIFNFK